MGNVIKTVRAFGSTAKGFESSEVGSKSKTMVWGLGEAAREVATYETALSKHRGMRKVEVHPAPNMSRSTEFLLLSHIVGAKALTVEVRSRAVWSKEYIRHI